MRCKDITFDTGCSYSLAGGFSAKSLCPSSSSWFYPSNRHRVSPKGISPVCIILIRITSLISLVLYIQLDVFGRTFAEKNGIIPFCYEHTLY